MLLMFLMLVQTASCFASSAQLIIVELAVITWVKSSFRTLHISDIMNSLAPPSPSP